MADANIDQVLNELGFGRMQLLIFFSCAMQQVFVSNEQLGLGLVSVASCCEYDIDDRRMAWLISMVFVAQVGSSHYMGYKSDEIGRRKLLLISSFLTMLFSFISSLMPDFWSFLVMRFLVGCVLTGPGMALVTYMSEFTKIALRPMVMNFISYSIGISMIYVPLMAMWLMPLEIRLKIWSSFGITSWRVLMMFNLLPGAISCLTLLILPESPKYLLSINQPEKALMVLEKCCRYNKGKDVTLLDLGFKSVSQPRLRSDSIDQHKFLLARMWYETKPLFQGVYMKYMLLILTILFVLFAIAFALTVWVPRILKMANIIDEELVLCDLVAAVETVEAAAVNNTSSISKCSVSTELLLGSIFNGCFCLALFILVTLLLLCLKRKIILLIYAVTAVFSGFMLNFIAIEILLVIFFIFLSVPPLCSLRLTLTVLIDLIPTHMRSKAVALAMMFGRTGILTASLFIGYTLKWNCYVTFNTFVVALLIAGILIALLPSESDISQMANK